MQWIPAHCGLSGNDAADRLAKSGSRLEQPTQPISYREAKTLVKQHFKQSWTQAHNPPADDQLHLLPRPYQTTIFRLRTGHCRLLSHMYRLGLSHTPDCPCQTALQTPEHILQSCPLHRATRLHFWPQGATVEQQLWGNAEQLAKTAQFIKTTNLNV